MSKVTVTIAGHAVVITEDSAPRQIWRGDEKAGNRRMAGEWPGPGWRYTVMGVMSGTAITRDAALARADYYARSGDKRSPRPRFALSREQADAVLDAEAADQDALLAAYPFDPEDVEALTKVGFLDASGAVAKDRDAARAILMGIVPNPFR